MKIRSSVRLRGVDPSGDHYTHTHNTHTHNTHTHNTHTNTRDTYRKMSIDDDNRHEDDIVASNNRSANKLIYQSDNQLYSREYRYKRRRQRRGEDVDECVDEGVKYDGGSQTWILEGSLSDRGGVRRFLQKMMKDRRVCTSGVDVDRLVEGILVKLQTEGEDRVVTTHIQTHTHTHH
eukprot:GHVR01059804.1.p2 GENE.GHVR01059804.1~~GHVR01059804.1.p2  ORF type:complete len:177 (+),score=89.85 GHVR01059804.1:188-718(+)